jgi:glycosyltransferase domain-containing protein
LTKVDVIIFTRERQQQLLRTIPIWQKQPFHFIILDNSSTILNYKLPGNIDYVFSPGMNFAGRARIAKDYLVSPYSIICCDDEFFATSSLIKMADFLDTHSKFSSVGGKSVGILKYGPRILVSNTYSHMNNYENTDTNHKKRITSYLFNDFQNTRSIGGMYRLYRRDNMKILLDSFYVARNFPSPSIFEFLGEIVGIALGPTINLPEIYWVRNFKQPMSVHPDWDRSIYFSEGWEMFKHSPDKNNFISRISNSLALDEDFILSIFHELALKLEVLESQKNKENKNKKNQLLYLKFFARFFLNNLPKNTIKKTLNGHNLKKKNILYDELVQGFKILMR